MQRVSQGNLPRRVGGGKEWRFQDRRARDSVIMPSVKRDCTFDALQVLTIDGPASEDTLIQSKEGEDTLKNCVLGLVVVEIRPRDVLISESWKQLLCFGPTRRGRANAASNDTAQRVVDALIYFMDTQGLLIGEAWCQSDSDQKQGNKKRRKGTYPVAERDGSLIHQ